MHRLSRLFLLLIACLYVLPTAHAQQNTLPEEWVSSLQWRSIGPANMGGRITALAVYEKDPTTYWAATASGGLLKTTNNGVTFEHQFDKEATVSIGDVCVAPSDPNIVWVGTGEGNPRNSVSYGDGVYKSTDGGKSWKNMGLKESFQIGRIAIHPTNPEIVYVGALGRLYGPNKERGLFKTIDGGKTWKNVLFVDDKTGVIEVQMHPGNPNILLAATYERQRDGFDVNDPAKKWGPGSGLHRSTDGGETWEPISKGLPTCKLGRMGIDFYRKDPNIVYMILESENIGKGPKPPGGGQPYMGVEGDNANPAAGATLLRVLPNTPAAKAGLKAQDTIVQIAEKKVNTFRELVAVARTKKPKDKVKLIVVRADKKLEIELEFGERGAGRNQTFDPNRPWGTRLGGQRGNIQNMQGQNGDEYGGVYKSEDAGLSWKRINSINPRPMYFSQIRVDPSDSRYVYVLGVSLAKSRDGGKSFDTNVRGIHADQHALWIDPNNGRHLIIGTDGGFYTSYDRTQTWIHHNVKAIGQFYHVAVDTNHRYYVYGGLQDNGSWGGPSRTRTPDGPLNEDWFRVGSGDGFVCRVDANDPSLIYFESQNGGIGRRNLETGEARSLRPARQRGDRTRYNWNWNTPFVLSSHNSKIYYTAGNYVYRSLDRGNNLQKISDKISATDRGSATALAESPRDANVLYVGTDDGALHVTRDGGNEWTDITKNVPLPGPRWVASIEASRFKDGRAYVAFDGHRSDDDDPLVFVTEDYGKTWKSIRANLPWGSTRVLREDISNENLLYVGTEFACWASLNRGETWTKINGNLPTVAIHEVAQHPTSGEIIVATHGRSIWIVDVTPLRQMKDDFADRPKLYQPATAVRWAYKPSRGGTNQRFVGQNPSRGANIYYSLPEDVKDLSVKIHDFAGREIASLQIRDANKKAGLHRAVWPLTQRGRRGQLVSPGTFKVTLTVDDKEYTQGVRVIADPESRTEPFAVDEFEEEEEEEEDLTTIE